MTRKQMDSANRDQHRIYPLLQQELVLTQRVLEILELEQKALEQASHDALAAATHSKQTCLAELNTVSRQRLQLLINAGLPTNREGMNQLLKIRGDSATTRVWQQLLETATRCATRNRHLGLLIQRNNQITEQALHILRHGKPGQPGTYSSSGETSNDRHSRSLGRV